MCADDVAPGALYPDAVDSLRLTPTRVAVPDHHILVVPSEAAWPNRGPVKMDVREYAAALR